MASTGVVLSGTSLQRSSFQTELQDIDCRFSRSEASQDHLSYAKAPIVGSWNDCNTHMHQLCTHLTTLAANQLSFANACQTVSMYLAPVWQDCSPARPLQLLLQS